MTVPVVGGEDAPQSTVSCYMGPLVGHVDNYLAGIVPEPCSRGVDQWIVCCYSDVVGVAERANLTIRALARASDLYSNFTVYQPYVSRNSAIPNLPICHLTISVY